MKLFKTIVIIVLAVMLTLSLSLNIFVFTMFEINDVESFKQVLLCRELLESFSQLSADKTTETPDVKEEVPSIDINTEDINKEDPVVPEIPADNTPEESNIIYEDTNVKVTYVKQEHSIFGPTIKFLVENKSTDTLDISFADVYIDGYMVEYCGAYVSSLASGRQSFETLYLYESDYEDFTEFPSMVEFTIKIQDADSWSDIAESEPIYIEVTR